MKQTYRTYELAKKWDCSQRTIRRMIDRGELPGFKIGGTWRVKTAEADQLSQKTSANSDKSDRSDN